MSKWACTKSNKRSCKGTMFSHAQMTRTHMYIACTYLLIQMSAFEILQSKCLFTLHLADTFIQSDLQFEQNEAAVNIAGHRVRRRWWCMLCLYGVEKKTPLKTTTVLQMLL